MGIFYPFTPLGSSIQTAEIDDNQVTRAKLADADIVDIVGSGNTVVGQPFGVVEIDTLTNADVNSGAAIDYSKLAALADNEILQGSVSNVATVTTMELAIRAGITGSALDVLRRNSGNTALEFAAPAAGGGVLEDIGGDVAGAGDTSLNVSIATGFQNFMTSIKVETQTAASTWNVRLSNSGSSVYELQNVQIQGTGITAARTTSGTEIRPWLNNSISAAKELSCKIWVEQLDTSLRKIFYFQGWSETVTGETLVEWNSGIGEFDTATEITSIDLVRTAGTGTLTAKSQMEVRGFKV